MEGSDHKVSLLPEEFKTMVKSSRKFFSLLDQMSLERCHKGKKINRVALGKSAFFNKKTEQGRYIN